MNLLLDGKFDVSRRDGWAATVFAALVVVFEAREIWPLGVVLLLVTVLIVDVLPWLYRRYRA